MGARRDCLTIHAYYWMQTWRVAPSAGEAKGAKRPKGRLALPPGSEDQAAAAWLLLPSGVQIARRLGLDLGIETSLILGGRH